MKNKNSTMLLLLLFAAACFFFGCASNSPLQSGIPEEDDDSSSSPDDDDAQADDDADDDSGPDVDDDTFDDDSELFEGFVPISAGTFTMGSPPNELGRFDVEQQHQVTLTRDFEIMATEVTQGRFETLMHFNISWFLYCGAQCPVEKVSWYDSIAYSNRLSERADLSPCFMLSDIHCTDGASGPDVNLCEDHYGIFLAEVALNGVDSVYDCEGYRLPTEAEWEYAARAGTQTAFYSGDITQTGCDPLDPALNAIGWYCGNTGLSTHPVGQKQPNAWGLYDVSGSVWEWVWDLDSGYPSDPVTDPEGTDEGFSRMFRGGSWADPPPICRMAERISLVPGARLNIGFRVVRTLP